MSLHFALRNSIKPLLLAVVLVNVVISLYILRGVGKTAKPAAGQAQPSSPKSSGELRIRSSDGKILGACPLQHTDVDADIAGYITRVHVRQAFANPLDHNIEAVYVFPLPQDSAVDDMVMTVGDRRIVGRVQEKSLARKTYDTAKSTGHVASLLDQERPNIFTQSVANIAPGAQVVIDISYVETLKYEDGVFTFVFPMVVGPRYMPGGTIGSAETQLQAGTSRVPDAARISPPVAPPSTRAGHDIQMTVHIDGGAELFDVKSELHAVEVQQSSSDHAVVTLRNDGEIPNRDFILHYRVAAEQVKDAFFVQPFPGGAYFTLALLPPRRVTPEQARPKEMIFVIDRSGSQEGFPIEKAKETMRHCIETMNPNDTFNLLSFSNEVTRFFESPQPNTASNRARALHYLAGIQADGGTEFVPALKAALERRVDPHRVRIVCFMTDGFVGNDFEAIDVVKQYAGIARVFSFGIGNSVNRFLLDGLAYAGRGEVEYVTLAKDANAAAERFHERVQSPVLTDIRIDWGALKAEEVYPRRISDLFSDKPILIHGLLKGPLDGVITLHGLTANEPFVRHIRLHQGDVQEPHAALASLWARAKVKDLMMQDMAGIQAGRMRDDLKKAITDLGVRFRLMTQFTSFVAVEEARRVPANLRSTPMTTVPVPVEKPDGLNDNQVARGQPVLLAQARAGDPLIRVLAPADAQQVIALLPGEQIKRLLFDMERQEWLARFDIPTYAAEGDYVVRVLIVLKDGSRKTLRLCYRVDTTAPKGVPHSRLASGPLPMLHLDLDVDEDTARVAALLPWGDRVELAPSTGPGKRFAAITPVPDAYRGKDAAVTFILTDRAHNRTTLTVDMSR